MKNSNPLFVDSTRMNGDSIATQVELNCIAPYLGEAVFIKVIDRLGLEQLIELERRSDTQVGGCVLLKHMQEITYQFVVARNGRPLFMSVPKTIRASYLLEEEWKPVHASDDVKSLFEEEFPASEEPASINIDLEKLHIGLASEGSEADLVMGP